MFPEFEIFGINLPVYGLVSLVGILVATFVGIRLSHRRDINKQNLFSLAIVAGVGLLVGANLLYALTRAGDIAELFSKYKDYESFWDFVRSLFEISSGMVFYGGLYGGLISGVLWAKHKKISLKDTSDLFSVLIPLFHAFGRIGCFFAGCCYGVKARWGISGRVVTMDVRESAKRVPVQLMEAGILFCLFLLFLWFFKRNKCEGKLIFFYLLIYAPLRFVLEFFRGDEIRGHFLMLSTSQWISIFTVLWVSVFLIITKYKLKKSCK